MTQAEYEIKYRKLEIIYENMIDSDQSVVSWEAWFKEAVDKMDAEYLETREENPYKL